MVGLERQRLALDFLGQPIYEGDTVVYPGRKGSLLWLSSGTVETAEDFGRVLRVFTPNGRRVRLQHAYRTVVVDRGA